MKQVELQIWNNKEQKYIAVDLDRSTQFPFVFEFNDIQNPTTIKVEWSKQVNLPMTKFNNDLFSQIWKFDSIIYNFDPLTRTNFRLYINGDLFQSGYIKLESITNVYNVRLFGGLAEYFYLLSEFKLKDMDRENEFEHKIDKLLVKNSWSENEFKNLKGNNINSFFGYAMTYQGSYDNFDAETVIEANKAEKVAATWTNPTQKEKDGRYSNPTLNEHRRTFIINGKTYYGEYRSYYQKPMVRVKTILSKIFSHIQDEGWYTQLDQSFFNVKNPYYNDLWIICPQYNVSESSVTQWGDIQDSMEEILKVKEKGFTDYHPIQFKASEHNNNILSAIKTNEIQFSPTNSSVYVQVRIPFRIKCINDTNTYKDKNYYFTSDDGKIHQKKLLVHIRSRNLKDANDVIIFKNPETGEEAYELRRDTANGFNPQTQAYISKKGSTYEGHKDDSATKDKKGGDATIFYMEANIPYEGKDTYSRNIEVALQHFSSSHHETGLYTSSGTFRKFHFEFEPVALNGGMEAYAPQDLRTDAIVNWQDIMKSEHSYFDFLISYAKIFGLLFTKNKYNKTVTIQTRNTFFARQEKIDWTDKLDYSKERTLVPLGFEYRIGEFKWAELNTKYEEDYMNRNARAYGSMRFNNNYYYTNQEVNFLDGIIFNNCIIASDYSQYYFGRDEKFPLKDNKILPFLQDNSDSKVDNNLTLVFLNKYKKTDFDFLITDDNSAMNTGGYCWNEQLDQRTECSSYPELTRYFKSEDPITGNPVVSSLNFGTPSIAYNDDELEYISENDTHGSDCIYHKFWQAYLTDRFDQNCKILTAYFHLTLNDITSNPLNKFIYINDTVWAINKIIDFNPLNDNSTKVELVKVKDIQNYVGQRYIEGEFKLYYPLSPLTQLKGLGNILSFDITRQAGKRTIRVTSTIDWEIIDHENFVMNAQRQDISPLKGTGSEQGRTTDITLNFDENTEDYSKYYYLYFQWGSKITILEITQQYGWTVDVTGVDGLVNINGGTFQNSLTEAFSNNTPIILDCQPNSGFILSKWTVNGQNHSPGEDNTYKLNLTQDTTATATCTAAPIGWQANSKKVSCTGGTVENILYTPPRYTYRNFRAIVDGVSAPEITFSFPLTHTTADTIKITFPSSFEYRTVDIIADIHNENGINTSQQSFKVYQEGNLNLTIINPAAQGQYIDYEVRDKRTKKQLHAETISFFTGTYKRALQIVPGYYPVEVEIISTFATLVPEVPTTTVFSDNSGNYLEFSVKDNNSPGIES